jgi:hypothetical protein
MKATISSLQFREEDSGQLPTQSLIIMLSNLLLNVSLHPAAVLPTNKGTFIEHRRGEIEKIRNELLGDEY